MGYDFTGTDLDAMDDAERRAISAAEAEVFVSADAIDSTADAAGGDATE